MIGDQAVVCEPVGHTWVRPIRIAFVAGHSSPLLARVIGGLREAFARLGHRIDDPPSDETDAIITSAPFGEPVYWRRALMFVAARRFGLSRLPEVYTLLHATPQQFRALLRRLSRALKSDPPSHEELAFPGLAPAAPRVLVDQGRRGGPILAALRVLQGQCKSIRVLLVVGDTEPQRIYHFDLVGAHPCSCGTPQEVYEDVVNRIATVQCTRSVNQHRYVEPPVPADQWANLTTPSAMRRAARELNARSFFTPMLRVSDLVQVPAVAAGVANQYSEGCFGTWDPDLGALIATVTGSATPVNKGEITTDDLAVIVGLREDASGVLVRPVEGLKNLPPSSEAVEMMDMDAPLPRLPLSGRDVQVIVPVIRSKLHGHRGVCAYHPDYVEYVPLDAAYYRYPVTCGSDAQARAIRSAFARSRALVHPQDPRQIVFTILPGHGTVIVEKWVPRTDPFQVLWEAMDAGYLVVDDAIPQGPFEYVRTPDGRCALWQPREPELA